MEAQPISTGTQAAIPTRSTQGQALRVLELYLSIQGESRFAGRACVFVRTAFCDLRCAWCDSAYTWTEPGELLEVEEVVDRVATFAVGLVEITGGEPMLWRAAPHLVKRLLALGHTVLVETGGSWDISVLDPRTVVVLDLKCPASGMTERMHWANLEHLRPHHEVKFVIADRGDYEWARAVVQRHQLPERVRVSFSPVMAPGTASEISEVAQWLLEDRLAVHLQPQLHKLIWPGISKGV